MLDQDNNLYLKCLSTYAGVLNNVKLLWEEVLCLLFLGVKGLRYISTKIQRII